MKEDILILNKAKEILNNCIEEHNLGKTRIANTLVISDIVKSLEVIDQIIKQKGLENIPEINLNSQYTISDELLKRLSELGIPYKPINFLSAEEKNKLIGVAEEIIEDRQLKELIEKRESHPNRKFTQVNIDEL